MKTEKTIRQLVQVLVRPQTKGGIWAGFGSHLGDLVGNVGVGLETNPTSKSYAILGSVKFKETPNHGCFSFWCLFKATQKGSVLKNTTAICSEHHPLTHQGFFRGGRGTSKARRRLRWPGLHPAAGAVSGGAQEGDALYAGGQDGHQAI